MRRALLVLLVALVCVPAAAAKQITAIVVIGPSGQQHVKLLTPLVTALQDFGVAPKRARPSGRYLLVYPLMENGIPMRPDRWYPSVGVLCSGWRTGVEAGCTSASQLRVWLAKGTATGLFEGALTHLSTLTREGTRLLPYGNEAVAIEMALDQVGRKATPPDHCVSFAARWTGPKASIQPTSFCVSPAGGVYADGKQYTLRHSVAKFVTS
jgi:hypothetical protein